MSDNSKTPRQAAVELIKSLKEGLKEKDLNPQEAVKELAKAIRSEIASYEAQLVAMQKRENEVKKCEDSASLCKSCSTPFESPVMALLARPHGTCSKCQEMKKSEGLTKSVFDVLKGKNQLPHPAKTPSMSNMPNPGKDGLLPQTGGLAKEALSHTAPNPMPTHNSKKPPVAQAPALKPDGVPGAKAGMAPAAPKPPAAPGAKGATFGKSDWVTPVAPLTPKQRQNEKDQYKDKDAVCPDCGAHEDCLCTDTNKPKPSSKQVKKEEMDKASLNPAAPKPHLGGKDLNSQAMTSDAFKAHKSPAMAHAAHLGWKPPTMEEHAARADSYSDFTPPGNFKSEDGKKE